MKQQKALRLKNGRKFSWFDCHQCFLPRTHTFRRNRTSFRKDRTITGGPPCCLFGKYLYAEVEHYLMITTGSDFQIPGFKKNEYSWTKKSIFWELPYWQHQLLRYNLDIMHIEKNFFENIINTIMDVPGTTKDNVKSRMNVANIYDREELQLQLGPSGKTVKLKAKFILAMDKRKELCEWVKGLNMPDGYCSNLRNMWTPMK